GHRLGPAPVAAPFAPAPGRAADLWWMATRGTRWVAARCADLLPGLLALAAAESRHRLLGTTGRLDAESARATGLALARLHPPHHPYPHPATTRGRSRPATADSAR